MTDTKQPPATENRWWDYVEDLCAANGINTAQFVRSVGVTGGAATAWKNRGGAATPQVARKVAYEYQRPVLEVFVNAGLLSWDDLTSKESIANSSPDQLSDAELIRELQKRLSAYAAENEELHAKVDPAAEPEDKPSGRRRSSRVSTVMRRPDTRD
ncbi:hypothetical protein [Nocardia rhizosphaerae]|uniref:Uncharacterized protein n=1 Tax=Nocardia rhizosphaerae TaxID=1691571 RepID=A0ABV8LFC3_9NOCA